MPLEIHSEIVNPQTLSLTLDGQLDTVTAPDLEKSIQSQLSMTFKTLIVDLEKLSYISSAGLRVFAKARKIMKSREGQVYFINPTPQVKKVFDIVKAVPISEVFASTEELDAYLLLMQTKTD
jgi:anti-sigma B factor antagonist